MRRTVSIDWKRQTVRMVSATMLLLLVLSLSSVLVRDTNAAVTVAESVCTLRTFVDADGKEIVGMTVVGRPPRVQRSDAQILSDTALASDVRTLSDVPGFNWSYGCSPTAAAMLFGYYDRTGYSNMYAGPANGGVCPMDNWVWYDSGISDSLQCPLSATHQGLDGRSTRGHVDDYWTVGDISPDPYIANGWNEHPSGECVGDFMGTSQDRFSNPDGGTHFFFDYSGDPMYDYTVCEPRFRDGCHGMKLFAESRGYSVLSNFSQVIQGQATDLNKGFTLDDFKAEIDAGRPVLIQLKGHTMLGFGYSSTGSTIYVRTTWDNSMHEMTWGGTYSGMQHFAVTVIRLAGSASLSVATNDCSNLAISGARLNGNLTSLGSASTATVSFVWGTTAGGPYPNETTTQVKSSTGAFYFDLNGLTAGTTYYYEAKAVGDGTAYGVEKSFTTVTPSTPPSVTTSDASTVTTSSARLNGNLTSLGTSTSATISFIWGTTAGGPYPNETTTQLKSTTGPFYFDLSSLTAGTTYYYKAKAVGDGTIYGLQKSFTTAVPTTPPSVTTNDASVIAANSARLNGNLTSLGSASSATVSFVWGTTAGGPYANETTGQLKTSTGAFYFDLNGLTAGTTYYYKAKAVGSSTSYGSEKSFATVAPTAPPSVTTNDASSVAASSARLNGNLTSLGTASSATISFVWGTTPGGPYPNETTGQMRTSAGAFSFDLDGLNPGITYYYQAKAVTSTSSYGVQKSFTTESASSPPPALDDTPPSVTIVSPNGGEKIRGGSLVDITWTALDNVGVTSVDIYYSIDGGATYPYAVTLGVANGGTYLWTVPDTPSSKCCVKVVARDAAANHGEDTSDALFQIQKSPPGKSSTATLAVAGAGLAILGIGGLVVTRKRMS